MRSILVKRSDCPVQNISSAREGRETAIGCFVSEGLKLHSSFVTRGRAPMLPKTCEFECEHSKLDSHYLQCRLLIVDLVLIMPNPLYISHLLSMLVQHVKRHAQFET